ncbi:MAG: ATP-binding protein, partial [Clostridia bacterium]|nr:ATP-binding protein [Clostridia bacterium]
GVIATNLDEYDSQAVFLDIGTNGEIGLCGKNGMYFCSAAAGPAFEGANIKCGMPGVPGAISSISNDGAIKTIGDVEPTGICGSGLIDAVAYMLNNGILDEDGAIDDEADNVVDIDGITAYQLTDKVFITQKDIRELQLAKAAICAGILTLIHKSNLKLNNISKVVLAGGFGSRINPDNAKTIGLIPKDLDCEIEFYGNTAGQGAIELLLSKQKRDRINSLVNISKYTELSNDAYFSNCYIEQMEF